MVRADQANQGVGERMANAARPSSRSALREIPADACPAGYTMRVTVTMTLTGAALPCWSR
ncbi:hypothetical protein GCM10010343_13080 [Streptomyces avidinii]|uniref:Uncharacterized protein n=1 Tax=Streptomyces avidinii TaxID=1895 RepID=A0ABS4KZM9_STRAV|nr:hypothetical protein [Streptomyces avidinii]GGY89247.1 hypothetical protein GCM10010343_13080 [Streptomyces avidinii]